MTDVLDYARKKGHKKIVYSSMGGCKLECMGDALLFRILAWGYELGKVLGCEVRTHSLLICVVHLRRIYEFVLQQVNSSVQDETNSRDKV